MTVTLIHHNKCWYRWAPGWELFSQNTKSGVRQEVKDKFGEDTEIIFEIRRHYGNRSSGNGSRPYKALRRREKYGRSAKEVFKTS